MIYYSYVFWDHKGFIGQASELFTDKEEAEKDMEIKKTEYPLTMFPNAQGKLLSFAHIKESKLT